MAPKLLPAWYGRRVGREVSELWLELHEPRPAERALRICVSVLYLRPSVEHLRRGLASTDGSRGRPARPRASARSTAAVAEL